MEIEPDTSKQSIGDRLYAVREARGFLRQAFIDVLGISAQRWSNYETGKTIPPPDILAKVWQVTGATSDFVLFGRYDGMPFELVEPVREILANMKKHELRRRRSARK